MALQAHMSTSHVTCLQQRLAVNGRVSSCMANQVWLQADKVAAEEVAQKLRQQLEAQTQQAEQAAAHAASALQQQAASAASERQALVVRMLTNQHRAASLPLQGPTCKRSQSYWLHTAGGLR